MSINALYVYTSTEFTISTPSTIEQLVVNPSGGYMTVQRAVSGQFTVEPGIYRYALDATLTPTTNVANTTHRGNTLSGFVIVPMDTKTSGSDPHVNAAATALDIPIDSISAFLRDAKPAVTLAAPIASGQPAHH